MTMRAIIAEGAGGPEVLRLVERARPEPGHGEVLIRVAAAGVNRPDLMQRKGLYPPPAGAGDVLGLEVAGTVAALGQGVEGWREGERICALVTAGGYADYVAVPADQCLEVPEALTMVEAAAIPETLFTVWDNLFRRGGAKAGDYVLVHGGTSGIGTMAILLGKLFDLKIIVTCGSAEKCARALEIGATYAIDYRAQDFVAEVASFTGGQGVAVVLDMVGGDYVQRNLACLADEGRHVSIAIQRGNLAEIPIFDIMRRRLVLTGSTLRARDAAFKVGLATEIRQQVWPHAASGRLRPVIDATFPLDQVAAAHARMESGVHVGKIVLETAVEQA